jgi:hypothetical protein
MNKSIRPWIRRVILPRFTLATIALLIAGFPMPGGGGQTPGGTPLHSAKAITAFSFVTPSPWLSSCFSSDGSHLAACVGGKMPDAQRKDAQT